MTITQELKLFLGNTPKEMEYLLSEGRISYRLYRHWKFLWMWSAPRYNWKHDVFYKKFGSVKYWNKIDKVNNLIEKIRLVEMPAPEHIPFAVGSLNK
jgi:hypothetical protein